MRRTKPRESKILHKIFNTIPYHSTDHLIDFSKEELKSSDMLLNGQAIYMETKSPAPDADPSLKVTNNAPTFSEK